jgi:PleD family two-component response regulator
MGICHYDKRIKSIEQFISLADEALYRAKKNGHNRIFVTRNL